MNSANVLIFTTALLAFLWTLGNYKAAKKEFKEKSHVIAWTLAAFFRFLTIIVVAYIAGNSGALSNFEQTPPPMMGYFLFVIVMAIYLSFSKYGKILVKHLSLCELIGFQSFRIFAELSLFLALREGLAPIALTFEGYNFDIVTAITAIFVAYLISKKMNPKLVMAWNIMGLIFLAIIMFIANTSMPTPFRLFMSEPSNIWVTKFPYILLPGVLVMSALVGHLLVFRKIKFLKLYNNS